MVTPFFSSNVQTVRYLALLIFYGRDLLHLILTYNIYRFVWVGMNTIFIYLLSPAAGGWEILQSYIYWHDVENNMLVRFSTHLHALLMDS